MNRMAGILNGTLLNSTISKRIQLAGVLGLGCCSVVPLYLSNPAAAGFFPPCPFRALTGFYCPGCGTLRALHQLLHGNLGAALWLNPLTVLALPFLGYALFSLLTEVFKGRSLPPILRSPMFTRLIFLVVMAFWALRNIPLYPFTLFAP